MKGQSIHAREFNGKRFIVDDVYPTKRDAEESARKLRRSGHNVRVVPTPIRGFPNRHIVYYRI